MKSLVYDGSKAAIRDDVEVRPPGPTEVKVRVVAAGLCHSDLSVIDGTIPWPPPAVLGHEGAGVVDSVGEAVQHVAPGDHVVLQTLAFCGQCKWCNTGRPAYCRKSIANASQPFTVGGEPAWNFAATSCLSEYTVVQGVQCVKIDPGIDLSVACLIGCGVLTGIGSVWNRTDLGLGDTCVVFGVGGVGLNVIQALKVQGATTIIAVDTAIAKESLAMRFGATHFLDGNQDDLVAAVGAIRPLSDDVVRGAFNGGGVDWAFDCVAHPQVTWNALECLDWGGTVVVIGVSSQTAEFHGLYGRLTQIDRGIIGCRYGTISPHRDIPRIIELYRRGDVLLDELVTATYPVEQWKDAVAELEAGAVARGVITFQ